MGNGKVKSIELALQGGGAHGAFTWGVLDRLLADDRLAIEGISGTSAGAMNAVVLAAGMTEGGRSGARTALEAFWRAVSDAARWSPLKRTPLDKLTGSWSLDSSPAFILFDLMSRMVSPYDVNPMDINPLRDLLRGLVDFDAVRRCDRVKLFINATNVRSGKVRVFRNPEIDAEVVLASACLPFLFQAVEIGGEAYWDGGYMGNPTLYPLVEECDATDMIIVQINPVYRPEVPRSARDIMNRLNEISFNATLIKEVRAVHQIAKLVAAHELDAGNYKAMHIHRIHANDEMLDLGVSSKMNAEWAFLEHLHDIGFEAADRWLGVNYKHIGARSTEDLEAIYLDGRDGHHGGQFL